MKKLTVFILALCIGVTSYGQAVDDEAIIPVSITLNSILRLNVTSGGNIEFVFNNIDQYKAGIANAPRYDTEFNVSSSINFDVDLVAENAVSFLGTDDPAHTMANTYVQILIAEAVAGNSDVAPAVATDLAATQEIVSYNVANGSNAGDGTDNSFIINWSVKPIIAANLAADRYSNNMFLSLRVPN
ncbi:MAG TPA: hypothetical protein DD653_02350 [Marinilabiliales bacterium]|nr:hypothetical protein [Marinilabiliales bacterium]HBO73513.1 hypothetical protein [Marinilabiliales bacterium]